MNKVIAGLLASSLMVSTAFADTYTFGTNCKDPSNPDNYYVEFRSDDAIEEQRGVVFYNADWSCKVKKFREIDDNVFAGKCVGADDGGVWTVYVELVVDYDHELLQVAFDGREFINLIEECTNNG
jgi:hypothetical protein